MEGSKPTHAFTQAAIAARCKWDPANNFIMRYEQPGMPRVMFNPHPFEFIDNGDSIELHGEEFDVVRTIHLDKSANFEHQPATPLGYSIGHWQGSNLIVETKHINWPYFDGNGTSQSEVIEILERFTLREDQSRLDYHVSRSCYIH